MTHFDNSDVANETLWYIVGMTEDDKTHVGKALRELCAVHRVAYNTNVFNGYWSGLQDLSRAEFDRALAHIQRHSEWMPKPASFRAALRQGWM